MIRRPPRSTQSRSSAASDVYKRQAQLRRQDPPVVRLGPGNVHELLQEDFRRRGTHERRREVQMVVVQYDEMPAAVAADLVDDRLGEQAIDRHVAVMPGGDLVLADIRVPAEVPQVVLDEPQHRVGDDVVEEAVRDGVEGDIAHRVAVAVELDLGRDRYTVRYIAFD